MEKKKDKILFWIENFQIHFGKGIVENEELFDVLRKHGEDTCGNYLVSVSGAGQWKNLSVTEIATGEEIISKKFRKKEFGIVLNDKEYSQYVEDLLEKAMVKIMGDPNTASIDTESYEEVRSIADSIELFDPED